MFPGMGGLNPKKLQGMMKQLGIGQEEIEASRVVIERDSGNIVIENPHVSKISMQGQESWQIVGDAHEEAGGIREEDVQMVMEKTGKSEKEARKVLEEVGGDIAESILKLS